MFKIDLGIKEGVESMIGTQANDSFIKVIESTYDRLEKLHSLYYEKKTINKKELDFSFLQIEKEFKDKSYERFGINILLRNSNTFAVIPIFNPDQISLTTFKSTRGKDVRHGIKQIKDFNRWLDSNILILDKKDAKFLNLPDDYYVPLFISLRMVRDLTKSEFVAIILHEIGHVFTLLELYSRSAVTTSILLSNFLRNKPLTETTSELGISKNPSSETNGLSMIYEKVKKDLMSIPLGGHGTGETNPEIEADNFTVKFGYGEELSRALVKLNKVNQLSFSNASAVIVLMSILGMAVRALLLSLLLPGGIVIMAAIALEIALTINSISKLLYMHNKRNPINDEHGSLKQRVEHIKTSMVEVLRLTDMNKKDKKLLLAQYEQVEKDLEDIDNSAHGKVLIGLMSEYLVGNLNTEDELASKLNELENTKLYIQEARFSVGLESINYMGKKDPVVNELISFFAKVKDNSIIRNVATFMSISEELEEITYKRFGLSIMALPAVGFGHGWACVPFNVIDQKGISDWRKYYSKSTFNIKGYLLYIHNNREILKDFKNGNNFVVDLEKAYIHGMKKDKHKSIVFIEYGRDMFGTTITGLDLTPEEMTAIYLHEIGHLFTYIESMKRLVVSNTQLLDSFVNREKSKEKHVIEYKSEYKKDAEEMLTLHGWSIGIFKQMLANGLLTITSAIRVFDPSFGMHLLTDVATKDNRIGSVKSFMTDSEIVADDFSTRMGMGKELVSGLDRLITFKIHNKAFIMLPLITYISLSIATMLAFSGRLSLFGKVLMLNLKFIFLAYALSSIYRLIAGKYFPYEKLPERFDSVVRSLIKVLRESDLSKEEVKEILNTITEVKKTKKEIEDMGYGSLLLSMFNPNGNAGKDITLDARIVDNLDKLINNDMFYHKLMYNELANGNEAMSDHNLIEEPANTIYYKEFDLWSKRVTELLNSKDLDKLNEKLLKYGVKIEDINHKYLLKTPVPVTIREGYTGFSIFEIDSDDEPSDKTVVTVTIDSDKVLWILRNPLINVYGIDVVLIGKYKKALYVVEMDYLESFKDDKKVDVIHKVYDELEEVLKEYGEIDINEVIDILKNKLKSSNEVKIPKEIFEQLDLIKDVLKDEHVKGRVRLDLHSGNWGVNNKGKIIMFDPIVNDISLGLRVDTLIDLNKYKKYLVKK